jgi:hypothetical protein
MMPLDFFFQRRPLFEFIRPFYFFDFSQQAHTGQASFLTCPEYGLCNSLRQHRWLISVFPLLP